MRGVKNNIAAYHSGLDWLTLSSFLDEKRLQDFKEFKGYILAKERETKSEVKECNFGDYSGIQTEGIQAVIRARDGHQMLRFFGETTDFYASEAIAAAVPAKVTRIDGAITARFKEPDPKYGHILRDRVERHDKLSGRKTHTPLDTYKRMGGDSGVTIGSRSSAVYSRIYDWALKHQEKSDKTLWRYEVELKAEAATNFWQEFQLAGDKPKLCAQMVATRLQKFGINETGFGKLEPAPVAGTRPRTDDERRLQYFESVIVPFISKLAAGGHSEKLREIALKYGLTDENGLFLPELL